MAKFQYLVPVDGSVQSDAAVVHAARFTDIYGAELTIVHVVDSSVYKEPEIVESMKAAGEAYLDQAKEIAAENNVTVKSAKVLVGYPFDEIIHEASEIDCSVIFIGATGISRSPYIGTVASRVLRGAECHVMLVRGDMPTEGYNNILIPTDGSESAEYAAHSGLSIAKRFGSKVACCNIVDTSHVVETRVVTAGGVGAGRHYGDVIKLSKSMVQKMRQRMLDESAKIAERVKEIADAKGVDARIVVRDGKPAQEILKIIRDEGIDLVVMGYTGKRMVSKLLMGSVSEKVASTAPCSVIVVRSTRMERVVPVYE
ncbi:MAG: universal stress protein [Methanosarcinales archaeon]|nr:universal stress protein [Methanosarcinales archaeon]